MKLHMIHREGAHGTLKCPLGGAHGNQCNGNTNHPHGRFVAMAPSEAPRRRKGLNSCTCLQGQLSSTKGSKALWNLLLCMLVGLVGLQYCGGGVWVYKRGKYRHANLFPCTQCSLVYVTWSSLLNAVFINVTPGSDMLPGVCHLAILA
eukprot:1160299-Pelagomonas_calceolata.AAC.2